MMTVIDITHSDVLFVRDRFDPDVCPWFGSTSHRRVIHLPRRPLSPCPTPDCPTLTPSGHCAKHRREQRRNQNQNRRTRNDPATSRDGPYRHTWVTTARRFLRRNPTCIDCGATATDADHVPPRQLLIAAGITHPDDDTWLQPRCHPCHSRATRQRDTPLLHRLRNGEDPTTLADLALAWRPPTHGQPERSTLATPH